MPDSHLVQLTVPPLSRYALIATLLGACGVGWRIWLTLAAAPPTNSDEATMGLAALHISQGQGLPIFFYGQHYMGTIEAYLAAPLVALFGPSVVALRAPTLLLYTLFLVLMFVLVRRLFSAGLAVLTVGLLAFGADRIVKNQLIAGGGYPESGPMVAGLLLLTYLLVVRAQSRWYAFAGWGILFGLIVWNHWLPAPYLLGALIVLIAGRVLTRPTIAVTVGGFVLGVLPLLIDNVLAAPAKNSIGVFIGLNSAGNDTALWDRIVGGAWLGLPLGMGLCAPSRCYAWSMWWGPVVVVLLAVAVIMAVRGLRRLRSRGDGGPDGETAGLRSRGDDSPAGETARVEWAVQALRLVLGAAGLLSILTYVRSPAAADSTVESARYLSMLAISLPAALWPLWRLVRSGTRWAIPAAVPIIALVATMSAATVSVTGALPGYREMHDNQRLLLATLDEAGLTYVHGEYWTCNWITYLSGERIRCGVINDELNRGFNRYPDYWRPQAQARLAPIGSPVDKALARRWPAITPQVIANYHLYLTPTA